MFAIIRTRWQTRPLSRRAKRRSSAAPGSLRKKYAGILHPPNMVRLLINSTTSGAQWKPVLVGRGWRRPLSKPDAATGVSSAGVSVDASACGAGEETIEQLE